MERLTERCGEGDVWVKNHDYVSAAYRLAAYEDTGLDPEDIKKHEAAYNECLTRTYGPFKQKISQWLQADKDGRLVVLPCNVGGTVYRLEYIEQTPGRFVVGVAEIKFALIWLEEFGKTVFLTREEAEKALEAMKDV